MTVGKDASKTERIMILFRLVAGIKERQGDSHWQMLLFAFFTLYTIVYLTSLVVVHYLRTGDLLK